MTIATGAVAIFTLAMVIVGVLQWGAMKGQLTAMSQQLEEMKSSSVQTEKLISANQLLAETAKNQLIASGRAWMAPVAIQLDETPTVGRNIQVRVTAENIGKEPALDTNIFARPIFVPTADFANGQLATAPNRTCEEVSPKKGATAVYASRRPEVWPLDTRVAADVDFMAGRKIFVIQGCFAYRTFETVRYTGFCVFLKPGSNGSVQNSTSSGFRHCPEGNFAT